MNQRHPQSPGTHHTAAVKKPTQRKVPAGKGLGWARAQRQSLRIDLCVPSTAPKARRCYLPLVPSPPPLVPRIRALRHESQHKKIVWIPPRYTLSWGLGDVSLSSKKLSEHKQGAKRAANARTRRSAARAAMHAERREQAELRLQQLACKMAKVHSAGGAHRTPGPLGCVTGRPLPPPPRARPSPLPLLRPPPRLRRRRPAAPTRAHALSLWLSGEAPAPHAGPPRASQTPATPPSAPKTKRRKPGAVAAALAAAATPQAHTLPPPKPPPTDAQPHRAALHPTRPLHPPRRRPPPGPRPIPTRTGLGPETNIPARVRECRPPQG